MSLSKVINHGEGEKHSLSKALLKSFSLVTATAIGCISIASSATAADFKFAFGSQGSGNGEFNFPSAIAVDSGGNIYVADTFNDRVQVFNPSGVFQSTFGSFGTGNGEFSSPYGIAVGSRGNIYVADTANNRVQVFRTPEPSSIIGLGILGGGLVVRRLAKRG
jgi:streptogramin lyase